MQHDKKSCSHEDLYGFGIQNKMIKNKTDRDSDVKAWFGVDGDLDDFIFYYDRKTSD